MNPPGFDKAPRAVQRSIGAAMFDFALIGLACYRGDDETMQRYGASLEEAALALEGALAEGNRWLRNVT